MEHKYNITGKIKTGKNSKVDYDLSKFSNVIESEVIKNKFSATIVVHFNANLVDLQNELGGEYSKYIVETIVLTE